MQDINVHNYLIELENTFRSMEDGRRLWLAMYLPLLSKDFLREMRYELNPQNDETKKIITKQYGEEFYYELFGRDY